MRGLHHTIAESDWPAVHALDAEQLQAPDHADDIENRVYSADFMQVHLLRGNAVDLAFHSGDRREGGIGAFAYRIWCAARGNELPNRAQVPAVRLRRNREIDFLARQPAADDVSNVDGDVVHTELRG